MKESIATPGKTKEILQKYNLKLAKGLGQNFLVNRNIINKIITAAKLKEDDLVIEIGPGIGALTQAILNRLTSGRLFAIEKDKRLIEVLADQFSNNNRLELINQDVLKIEWRDFLRRWDLKEGEIKVLANLPYYITTPIIMSLLESGVKFSRLVFMVQKEVAERMVALPGGKDYGALSIAVQYYSKAEIIHTVSPAVFIPQPEVYSTVIALEPYPEPPVKVLKKDFFFKIVRAIFQQRRKNIKNALSKAANINLKKERVLESLAELDIDQRIRGEKLTLKQIAELSNLLWKKSGERNEIY